MDRFVLFLALQLILVPVTAFSVLFSTPHRQKLGVTLSSRDLSRLWSSRSPSAAISIENLSCTHDGGAVFQLQDVSYVLPFGARVAVVGRNGSGKSTFLRILAATVGYDGNTEDLAFSFSGHVSKVDKYRICERVCRLLYSYLASRPI
jgi:ABC-type bacteriocin/lantibiotic exporter with double-glycine peptidase domain